LSHALSSPPPPSLASLCVFVSVFASSQATSAFIFSLLLHEMTTVREGYVEKKSGFGKFKRVWLSVDDKHISEYSKSSV
jgi:hypothetical protein